VHRRPYSVILLDEIEKAHGDVFNLLLQILDDGRLTDGHGRTVDFKNTVIIMTSNIGSHLYQDTADKERDEVRDMVMETLKVHFRPEFLNRLDEIIIFNPLGMEEIKQIVDIQIEYLRERLADRKLDIRLTAKAKETLAAEGFDPNYGARPLKRVIQRQIQDNLARRLLEGEFADGDLIEVDVDGSGGFTFARAGASAYAE
jgi:ATP-dependent Clp protease ATP-binding subunit ClpB